MVYSVLMYEKAHRSYTTPTLAKISHRYIFSISDFSQSISLVVYTRSVKIMEVKENVLKTIHPGNTAIDVTIRAGAYNYESICEILRRLYSHYNDASLQSIRFVGGES